ncbi:dispanin subfamily A member 2b-like [Tiliqua scincoides]|uniref:dispanin subfamily A member 2b-like n=1 Tax=Tiliqua scincoides TaxID=71010 RepID=UPI0034631B36
MQSSAHGVAIPMQPYPDGKEEAGGAKARAAQILRVKDYVLWSLCSFGIWNACCLGFAALVASVKSRDRKVVGDVEGASYYGKRAKCLNISAVILSVLFVVIFIVLIATGNLPSVQREIYSPRYPSDSNQYGGK